NKSRTSGSSLTFLLGSTTGQLCTFVTIGKIRRLLEDSSRFLMLDRYFVPKPIAGEHARLTDEEAHHLSQVMRAGPGHEVLLFDGSGAEWQARGTSIGRAHVDLQFVTPHEVHRA